MQVPCTPPEWSRTGHRRRPHLPTAQTTPAERAPYSGSQCTTSWWHLRVHGQSGRVRGQGSYGSYVRHQELTVHLDIFHFALKTRTRRNFGSYYNNIARVPRTARVTARPDSAYLPQPPSLLAYLPLPPSLLASLLLELAAIAVSRTSTLPSSRYAFHLASPYPCADGQRSALFRVKTV